MIGLTQAECDAIGSRLTEKELANSER